MNLIMIIINSYTLQYLTLCGMQKNQVKYIVEFVLLTKDINCENFLYETGRPKTILQKKLQFYLLCTGISI